MTKTKRVNLCFKTTKNPLFAFTQKGGDHYLMVDEMCFNLEQNK